MAKESKKELKLGGQGELALKLFKTCMEYEPAIAVHALMAVASCGGILSGMSHRYLQDVLKHAYKFARENPPADLRV